MLCNCKNELENKLKRELPKQDSRFEGLEVESIQIEGYSVMFIDDQLVLGYGPKAKVSVVGRANKKTVNLTASYCPFCGKKAK